MGLVENKELVRRYIEGFNYGRLRPNDPRYEKLEELCTEDYTRHFSRAGVYGEQVGLEHFKVALTSMLTVWSKLSFELHDLVAEDDKVVERFVIHGTIAGDFRGFPAAGKHVSFAANNLLEIREGKISAEWIYEDFLSVFQQIGALPPPS